MSDTPNDAPPDGPRSFFAGPLAGHTAGAPSGSFVIAEWKEPPSHTEPALPVAPLHVHHEDDEAWYVLEGTLRFRLGDREVDAPAGTAVFAPRGLPHTYWNPGPTTTRYVIVMTPNTYSLIEALHSGPRRDQEATRALYRKHGCDLVAE